MRGELNTNMKDKTLNNKSKQQSFLHGSLILVVATALVKIIGAIYRIPLANILDTAGMGFYSTAYDLYVPMYSIAMAGLPVAISRIVAEHTASGKYKDAKKTLKMAQLAFLVTGSTGFILMLVLAFVLTGPLGVFNIGSLPGILAIAPCLVFCCIMSAYRGYYEGLRNMTPTAISSVIEALGKLVFGFSLAYVILTKDGKRVAVATDMGHLPKDFYGFVSGCDGVVLESNYDEDMLYSCGYPYYLKRRIKGDYGHLSNVDCAKTVWELYQTGVKKFVLAHLSINSNYPDLAFATTESYLKRLGVSMEEICLKVAPRNDVMDMIEV